VDEHDDSNLNYESYKNPLWVIPEDKPFVPKEHYKFVLS
jgi:hypothetical protein